jgi:predicted transcriptional regulator
VAKFLDLSAEESALIETRLALSRALRERRRGIPLSQSALAERLGSSQSRIAKAETGQPDVSLDLIVRALFAAGAMQQSIADALLATR